MDFNRYLILLVRTFLRLPHVITKNVLLSALVLFFSLTNVAAQKKFDFNSNCQYAYREIIQLKLANGQRLLDNEKKINPENLIPCFLENYIDFFTLFFNDDPDEYKKRVKSLEIRLNKMEEGPESSPFKLFSRSIIYFQWASIKIKFGYAWDGGWAFRRSFLVIKENQELFPSFYPNELYRGAMQVTAGTVPDSYKWLSNLMGIKGTLHGGFDAINTFISRTDEWSTLFHEEGLFYYCYLKFFIENDKEGVFRFIQQQQMDLVNNHLFAYLATNLSINNQQSENAKKIIASRNLSADYLATPIWDKEMGQAKLNHLEADAPFYFERFLEKTKGNSYVKEVLQKLSWYYYLMNDQARADRYRAALLRKGALEIESDKQAQKEAKANVWPNKLLLKARLLNDGGYIREALRLLHGKKYIDFNLPAEQTEFEYRAARLYDDLGAKAEAVEFYKKAIALGEHRKEYFAARAALQIAIIYEQQSKKSDAIIWYQYCINLKDHEYKNSLDQRAKAGIARCKNQ